jgi:O-antigen ligase
VTALIGVTVFLIYMNVPAVLVTEHGVPKPIALLLPLLLAIPVAYRVLMRGESLRFPGMIVAALLMLGCHTVSALVSGNPGKGMGTVFSWLSEGVLLAFILVNALRTRREVFTAARAVVAAGAVMGFVVLLQQLLGPTEYGMAGFGQLSSGHLDKVQHRLSGPIGEQNRFAQIMVVVIPLAAGLAVSAFPRLRWRYWLAIMLICGGVLLTFSRGALVALVMVLPFALLFGFVRLRQLVAAIIGGAVLITAMSLMTSTPYLVKRVASIGEVVLQTSGLAPGGFRNADGATRGRLTSMKAAGLLFLDHPLLGAGPGLAPSYYQEYALLAGGKVRAETRRTHNLYLQMASETGVIGLSAFFLVIWMVLRPVNAVRRRTFYSDRQLWGLVCGLQLAVLMFLMTSIFLHAAYVRYCWLLLGLAVAAAALPSRTIRPETLGLVARIIERQREQQGIPARWPKPLQTQERNTSA